jgi:hypothetical protein
MQQIEKRVFVASTETVREVRRTFRRVSRLQKSVKRCRTRDGRVSKFGILTNFMSLCAFLLEDMAVRTDQKHLSRIG